MDDPVVRHESNPPLGTNLLGVLLAGGRSRRFGSPKALATVRGRRMADWGFEALDAIVGRAVLITNDPVLAEAFPNRECRPDLRTSPGIRALGPAAGIETALEWAHERGLDGALVLGCDMPNVRSEHLHRIVDAWPGRGIAVPVSDSPLGCEPLCAVYGVDRRGIVSIFLDRGYRDMETLMRSPDPAVRVELSVDADVFWNVNTVGDLEGL